MVVVKLFFGRFCGRDGRDTTDSPTPALIGAIGGQRLPGSVTATFSVPTAVPIGSTITA
jgi:hypothetical protein